MGDGVDGAAARAHRSQSFEHHEYGEAIVKRLGDDILPDPLAGSGHRDGVAQLDFRLDDVTGKSEVDVEVCQLSGLGTVGIGAFGGRLKRPEKRLAGMAMHLDALSNEVARVEPAKRLDAQETFVVDMLDHEPNLVHVGRDHHRRTVEALLCSDHAPHRINANLVHERRHLRDNQLPESSPRDPARPASRRGAATTQNCP